MKIIAKIIIAAAIFFAGFYFGQQQALSPANGLLPEKEINVNLILNSGAGQIKNFYDIALSGNATVFDLLKKTTTENNISLSYKDYGQELGVFIESINNLENDISGNKYWQYWVNGGYAEIGASNYHLKDGDTIEWRYAGDQFAE
ncbi:DUF4430 domain-containing protein [Candidatus Falkowbacteria bacterium]|nr:DUF4430 domain-containing protein [Candidatus Falkowbacteria bacterium]